METDDTKHPFVSFGAGCPNGGIMTTYTWSDFNRVYGNNEHGYAELWMVSESGEVIARVIWRKVRWM